MRKKVSGKYEKWKHQVYRNNSLEKFAKKGVRKRGWMGTWSKSLSWFCLFLIFNISDVTGCIFMNEKDLEERENYNAGEGIISEAMYLRESMGSVHI